MKFSTRSFVGLIAALSTMGALYACSSGDDEAAESNSSSQDATTSNDDGSTATGDSSATDDGSTTQDSSVADSGALSIGDGGGGIRVTDKTGTYDLDQGATVETAGNGKKFGAASFAGGALRSVAIILRHQVINDAGSSEFVEPVPGTYKCNDPLDAKPGMPAYSAVIQYGAPPGPVFYQSELTSNCEVVLSTYGAVGAHSTGTFAGYLPQAGNADAGVDVTGQFDLVRKN